MVASSGPASPSPAESARSSALLGALDRLKQRPVLTEEQSTALANLTSAAKGMKAAPKQAAAAKVAYLKNKLMAIKLAAGISSATGDPKLARVAIREMRALIKELDRALRDAGITGPAAATTIPADSNLEVADDGKVKLAETRAPAETKTEEPGAAEASQARSDAQGLVKELKKVVLKLKQAVAAAHIRGADPAEIKKAEKDLQDGEKELRALEASLGTGGGSSGGSTDGRTVDLSA